jgi:hypothetical protein
LSRRKLDEFIEESRARQRNIVFPDTVRNGRSVDAFFWNGSPDPPLVQRIAAWIFGLFFIGIGLALFSLVPGTRNREPIGAWFTTLISVLLVAAGIRVFRNGFPRRIKPTEKSN